MCLLDIKNVPLLYWRGFSVLIFLLTRATTTTKTLGFGLKAIVPFSMRTNLFVDMYTDWLCR